MSSPWLIPGILARLRELHALQGDAELTMQQIADALNAEFGTTFTRNAIIGRSHRLNLPKRPSPLPPKPVKQEIVEMAEEKIPIETEVAAIVAPKSPFDGVSIYELDRDSCRFILDDVESRPPFTYCGKRTIDGSPSWCKQHYQRVYVATRQR